MVYFVQKTLHSSLFSQLFMFVFYFFCVMACFLNRPTPFQRTQYQRKLLCAAHWDWHGLKGRDMVSLTVFFFGKYTLRWNIIS